MNLVWLRLSVFAALAAGAGRAEVLLVGTADYAGGIYSTNAVTGGTLSPFASLWAPMVARLPNGDVLAGGGSSIVRLDSSGNTLGTFANVSNVFGIAVASDGTVYVSYYNASDNAQIAKFSSTGTSRGTIIPGSSGTNSFEGLALAANGNIVVSNFYSVLTYNSFGQLLGSTNTSGGSFNVTVGPDGNVYYTTSSSLFGNNAGNAGNIYKCTGCATGSGTSSLFASDPAAGDLHDLVFDGNGNLFVASRSGNDVLDFNASTGAYEGVFASGSYVGPITLALDSATTPAPEPSTWTLFAGALLTLPFLRRR